MVHIHFQSLNFDLSDFSPLVVYSFNLSALSLNLEQIYSPLSRSPLTIKKEQEAARNSLSLPRLREPLFSLSLSLSALSPEETWSISSLVLSCICVLSSQTNNITSGVTSNVANIPATAQPEIKAITRCD